MNTGRAWVVALIAIGLSAAAPLQGIQSTPLSDQSQPTFHIGVDAVRIDAVVTDRDGRLVTDLTADDFELKDDGRPQKVTLATFVPVASGPTPAQAPAMTGTTPPPTASAPVSAAPLKRDQVQRSLVILVDDLGISWESLHSTQLALHKFVDQGLQSTDLVALTRTGMVAGMQRQFTTDRRILHSAVDQLRWTALSRRWVEPFDALEGTGMQGIGGGPGGGVASDPAAAAKLSGVREIVSALATLSAANLTVRAMTSLPGRKALVFVTEGFDLYEGQQIEPRIQAALDALWDQAARAGVIIYTIEARGLQTGMLIASDNTSKLGSESAVRDESAYRNKMLMATQDSLDLVARETGGFAVMNTNDLARGLQRIVNDIRGFYLIGYTPDRDGFVKKGATIPPHNISLKVKRPGLKVRTHQSFIGRPESETPTMTETPQHALLSAAMSPFAESTMAVKLTPLWGYSAKDGASIKALLHLDAAELQFGPASNGESVATAEAVGVIVDADGSVVTARNATFSVHQADGANAIGGVTYSLLVPVPKPGGYQMRFAVRDTHSGALGSVGEFVEVPDVAHGTFAISSVMLGLRHSPEPVVGAAAESVTAEDNGTTAVRQFSRGDEILYTYEVYNPQEAIEVSPSVWRDGKQIFVASLDTLKAETGEPLRAAGALRLGAGLPPGDYVLQMDAKTAGAKGKRRTAQSRVDFEVR